MRCPAHTTAPSDSLIPVCLSSFIIGWPAYSPPGKRFQGLPGYHIFTLSDMPCSQTPGKRKPARHYRRLHVDFRVCNHVILPILSISGLNHFNLTAYGLSSGCPTLNRFSYPQRFKDSLPGGWLDLPGRASHPLEYATLPGRTANSSWNWARGKVKRLMPWSLGRRL